LTQKLQSFCSQFRTEEIDSCQITTGLSEIRNETELHWVIANNENHRDCCGCGFSCQSGTDTTSRSDHCDLPANQVGRQFWQSIQIILCPAVLDRYALTLHEASVT
jgi:hypothetical protein